MYIKLFTNGLAVISLITAGCISSCNAAHGHKHGDVLGRIMHKPIARSGSSFNVTTIAAADGPVILPSHTTFVSGCFGKDCVLSYPTHSSNGLLRPTPVQAHYQSLELRHGAFNTLPSRRRNHHRAMRTSSEDGSATHLDLGAATAFAMPTGATPTARTNPQASHGTQLGSVLKNASEEHAAIHRHVFDVQVTHHILKGIAPRQDGYESSVLAGLSSPTSTSASAAPSATAISVCPGANGTIYTSAAGIRYLIVCDVDYPGNDYPFRLVDTFASCVQACDIYNYDNHHVPCVAALFIASRETTTNDCYLKSSIKNPTAATLQIHGAIRLEYTTNSSSTSSTTSHSSTSTLTSVLSNSTSITTSTSGKTFSTYLSTSSSSAASSVSSPAVTYASGDNVIVPKVARSRLQGPTVNTPSTQYLDIKAPASITLAKSLLTIGAKGDFSTGYNISPQTGVLEVNISTQSYLSSLTDIPHLSRDGGKGGMLNGEHLFIFCDTGSYSPPSYDVNGEFLGFVSSSVAIDTGMNGLSGHALHLKDGIGEWSDKAGRMRGFAPLTEGEQAYNLDMQGNGQRYAVWPEASIIPIDATTGIIYAPIVYDNVNMATKAAVFTYTGATLLTITVGGQGGPVAQRTVDKIFDQDEVEWGCAGGIRSWGASGVGGDDGSVYVFGNVAGGLLVGRTSPANVADVSSFEYWDGSSWNSDMPSSSSAAYFIEGAFMDIDIFYSPRHLTFIIVYLTIYADSTFYYRYLEADQGILPPFAPGGDSSSDYVENILKYNWSEQQVLYKAAPGLGGKYIYSGGVHLGYYGSNDMINGGTKMLLSWTAPTGLDPSTLISEYQIMTAEVDWA